MPPFAGGNGEPEGILKLGFWFQIRLAANYKPEEYFCITKT
jgi:hypothetical protein